MKFQWTVPNLLTIFRVILIPVLLYLIMKESLATSIAAILVFSASAVTDALDGYLARKWNQTSDFGAFFDPLADKFLIWGVFTVFCFNPGLLIPWWLVLFIYLRDLFVTFLRAYSRKKNIRFKTSFLAKAKTGVQMGVAFAILVYMLISFIFKKFYSIPSGNYMDVWKTVLPAHYPFVVYFPLIVMTLTVLFTVLTAADYYITFKKNRDLS